VKASQGEGGEVPYLRHEYDLDILVVLQKIVGDMEASIGAAEDYNCLDHGGIEAVASGFGGSMCAVKSRRPGRFLLQISVAPLEYFAVERSELRV